MKGRTRRTFLKNLGAMSGGAVLAPLFTSCSESEPSPANQDETPAELPGGTLDIPRVAPEGWDPIAFNRERGNAGAIPETYLDSINGPDGEMKHLGKHLPWLPEVDPDLVPEGHVAIMWGDAAKGHARHPNAVPSEANANEGHWYNWIRLRMAVDGEAEEVGSVFTGWPETGADDTGAYAVLGDGAITDDGGRNTIYLVWLPADVGPGDTVRVWAHCLTHGEYVDFVTL